MYCVVILLLRHCCCRLFASGGVVIPIPAYLPPFLPALPSLPMDGGVDPLFSILVQLCNVYSAHILHFAFSLFTRWDYPHPFYTLHIFVILCLHATVPTPPHPLPLYLLPVWFFYSTSGSTYHAHAPSLQHARTRMVRCGLRAFAPGFHLVGFLCIGSLRVFPLAPCYLPHTTTFAAHTHACRPPYQHSHLLSKQTTAMLTTVVLHRILRVLCNTTLHCHTRTVRMPHCVHACCTLLALRTPPTPHTTLVFFLHAFALYPVSFHLRLLPLGWFRRVKL